MTGPLPRRGVLCGLAALPSLAALLAAAAPRGSDAALIEACRTIEDLARREEACWCRHSSVTDAAFVRRLDGALSEAGEAALEDATSAEASALTDQLCEAVDAMAELRSHTLAGLAAKARAVLAVHDPYYTTALMISVCDDARLLGMPLA